MGQPNAETKVIQHALERGYLTAEQLNRARHQLGPNGAQEGALLELLRRHYLAPEHHAELAQVYQAAQRRTLSLLPETVAAPTPESERGRTEVLPDTGQGASLPRAEPFKAFLAGELQGSPPSLLESAGNTVGPYEITEEIARGGMGVVYRARHPALGRDVAIKMLLSGRGAAENELERFYTEVRAAARLRHPNIVAIHDVGVHGGRPFFVMDLIEGESLQARIDEQGPLEAQRAAGITRAIAEALYYAHSQQLLHRDVKPLNIMISSRGEPLLTDFGLAKEQDSSIKGVTVSGQFLGTPAFASPEQAMGAQDRVDRRSDIYSLGATLYAMLVGRPPFEATALIDLVVAVTTREPVAPIAHRPKLDRDLNTICLKCLEKDPQLRYDSARALAEDLGRYLAGDPIHARPVGFLMRTLRRARRNRAVVAAGIVALVLGFAMWLKLTRDVYVARQDALEQKDRAVEQAKRAEEATADAVAARDEAERERAKAETERQQAEVERAGAQHAAARALLEQGFSQLAGLDYPQAAEAFALAYVRLEGLELDESDALRRSVAYGAREAVARYGLLDRFRSNAGAVLGVAASPDGKTLAIGSWDKTVTFWNRETGDRRDLVGHEGTVLCCSFRADGRILATGSSDKTVRLWGVPSGQQLKVLRGATSNINDVRFTPDGSVVLAASSKFVKRWEVSSGEALPDLEGHASSVYTAAISPDGSTIASASRDKSVRLWDAKTGAGRVLEVGDSGQRFCGFRPDGVLVSATREGTVSLWDVRSGERTKRYRSARPTETLLCSLSPDGETLALASQGGVVRLVDLASGGDLLTLASESGIVVSCPFTPDGKSLLIASSGTVEVRSLSSIRPEHTPAGPQARFMPKGNELVWAERDAVVLRDFDKGTQRRIPGQFMGFAVSDDGALLVLPLLRGKVQVMDLATAKVVDTFGSPSPSVAFAPGGRIVAATGMSGERLPLSLRDVRAKRTVAQVKTRHRAPVIVSAFSRDGTLLATGDLNGVTQLWAVSAEGLEPKHALLNDPLDSPLAAGMSRIAGAVFSPSGDHLVTGSMDGWIRYWRTDTGMLERKIKAHTAQITGCDLDPSGVVFATASPDQSTKLWDLATGRLLRRIAVSGKGVSLRCAFSPDGTRLVVSALQQGWVWRVTAPPIPGFEDDPTGAVRRALLLED